MKKHRDKKIKRKNLKNATVDHWYRQHPNFTDCLPWLDYEPESQTFTLEDGFSAAVCLEVRAVASETLGKNNLEQLQAHIQLALVHGVPQVDPPFVLQCFVQDEPSLDEYAQALRNYQPFSRDQAPLRDDFLQHLQDHLKRIAQPEGLFVDEAVSHRTWRGQIRKIRLCLYRRHNPKKALDLDPAHEVNEAAAMLVAQLQTAGLSANRCTPIKFYDWLFPWFNPNTELNECQKNAIRRDLQPSKNPKETPFGFDLSALLLLNAPRSDEQEGIWWFDGKAHRALTVDVLRRKPEIGHLSRERAMGEQRYALMDALPPGSIFSFHITVQTQDQVEEHVRRIGQSAKGDSAEAQATEQEAESAQNVMAHGDALFPCVMTIYLQAENAERLKKQSRDTQALLLAQGLQCIHENDELIALDTYIRHLPMNYEPARDKNRQKSRWLFSSDLSKLLPFYGRSTGTPHPGWTFFNRGAEPLCFDPLNSKDRAKNAFGLVLGPPGSGKSALMVYVLLQILSFHNARVFIIEKGGSFQLLGEYAKQNGLSVNTVNLHPSCDVSLPPFADALTWLEQTQKTAKQKDFPQQNHPPNPSEEEDNTENRDLLGEMELKARVMITGGDPKEEAKLSRADRRVIREAIKLAAEQKQQALKDNPSKENQTVTVDDVVNALSQLAKEDTSESRSARIQDMADAMALYTSGTAGHFFNRQGQAWPEADITLLEMGMLVTEGYEDQLALGVMGLFYEINALVERDQYDPKPTFVLIDEAHLITTHPLLAPFLVKIVKMWRKLGTWLWLATQNMEDFPESAKKLLSLFEWWIAMVCPKEQIEHIAKFKDLSEEQKQLLLQAKKSPGQYTEGVILSDKLQTLFRNVPPPLALALAMTEKNEKQQRVKIMEENNCSELEAALAIVALMSKQAKNLGYLEAKAEEL